MEERAIVVAREVRIEPGLELGVVELIAIDARLDGGADQDFTPCTFLPRAAGGEGARPGVDALLLRFELLELYLERADPVTEFGHGVPPFIGVQGDGRRFDIVCCGCNTWQRLGQRRRRGIGRLRSGSLLMAG